MNHDTNAIGDIKEMEELRATAANLQQKNATLEAKLEDAKKLIREDTARIAERTNLLIQCQDRLALLEAELLAMKSEQGADPSDTISIQDAWKAAGGNPGHIASLAELLYNLKLLDDVCEDMDDPDNSEQSNGAVQRFTLRAVPRTAVKKAIDTLLRDISSGLIDALRAEPSLSLPGQKRLAVYADRVRAMQVDSYIEEAIEGVIAQFGKATQEK